MSLEYDISNVFKVNLSKHLQKTNEKEFEDLVDSFPSFLWVLRDFALKLVDPRGNPITARVLY